RSRCGDRRRGGARTARRPLLRRGARDGRGRRRARQPPPAAARRPRRRRPARRLLADPAMTARAPSKAESAAAEVELHIVSDSTGETAARLVLALEAQFPG